MEDISIVRQNIYTLNKDRWHLTQKILKTENLLTTSFYERFTKCGSPTCKCSKGELHGPFYWIYQNKKGKKFISTSCVSDKISEAKLYSDNYKAFKEYWSEVKRINEKIDELIGKIQYLSEINAQEFTQKKGETRGRKQKKIDSSIE